MRYSIWSVNSWGVVFQLLFSFEFCRCSCQFNAIIKLTWRVLFCEKALKTHKLRPTWNHSDAVRTNKTTQYRRGNAIRILVEIWGRLHGWKLLTNWVEWIHNYGSTVAWLPRFLSVFQVLSCEAFRSSFPYRNRQASHCCELYIQWANQSN